MDTTLTITTGCQANQLDLQSITDKVETPEAQQQNLSNFTVSAVKCGITPQELLATLRKVQAIAQYLDAIQDQPAKTQLTSVSQRCQEESFARPFWSGALALGNNTDRDEVITALFHEQLDYTAAHINESLSTAYPVSPDMATVVERVWNQYPLKRYLTFTSLVDANQVGSLEALTSRTIPFSWWSTPRAYGWTPLASMGDALFGPLGRKMWRVYPELHQTLVNEFLKQDPMRLFDVRDLQGIGAEANWKLFPLQGEGLWGMAYTWAQFTRESPDAADALFEYYPFLPQALMSLAQRAGNAELLVRVAAKYGDDLVFEAAYFGDFILRLQPEEEEIAMILLTVMSYGSPDLQVNSSWGITLLECAVYKDFWRVFDKLLSLGADINQLGSDSTAPVHLAAARSNASDWFIHMHAHGANFNLTNGQGLTPIEVLIIAQQGRPNLQQLRDDLSLLLALGASKEDPRIAALVESVAPGLEVIPYYLHPVWLAAAVDPSKETLPLGANEIGAMLGAGVNKAPRVSNDIVLQLFQKDAVRYAFCPWIGDQEGYPALVDAVWRSSQELCQIFLDLGCYIDQCHWNGWTALDQATMYGKVELTQWLLDHGANPNGVTDDGRTPLIWVIHQVRNNRLTTAQAMQVINLLMSAGADTWHVDNCGASARSEIDHLSCQADREALRAALGTPDTCC